MQSCTYILYVPNEPMNRALAVTPELVSDWMETLSKIGIRSPSLSTVIVEKCTEKIVSICIAIIDTKL